MRSYDRFIPVHQFPHKDRNQLSRLASPKEPLPGSRCFCRESTVNAVSLPQVSTQKTYKSIAQFAAELRSFGVEGVWAVCVLCVRATAQRPKVPLPKTSAWCEKDQAS